MRSYFKSVIVAGCLEKGDDETTQASEYFDVDLYHSMGMRLPNWRLLEQSYAQAYRAIDDRMNSSSIKNHETVS